MIKEISKFPAISGLVWIGTKIEEKFVESKSDNCNCNIPFFLWKYNEEDSPNFYTFPFVLVSSKMKKDFKHTVFIATYHLH